MVNAFSGNLDGTALWYLVVEMSVHGGNLFSTPMVTCTTRGALEDPPAIDSRFELILPCPGFGRVWEGAINIGPCPDIHFLFTPHEVGPWCARSSYGPCTSAGHDSPAGLSTAIEVHFTDFLT